MATIGMHGWEVSADLFVLTHLATGDRFDISHWTWDDIEEFLSDGHDRESHAEMLERLPS